VASQTHTAPTVQRRQDRHQDGTPVLRQVGRWKRHPLRFDPLSVARYGGRWLVCFHPETGLGPRQFPSTNVIVGEVDQ
jgi:hypothetical protein